MFENLQEKLQRAFKSLRGQATLTEENIDEALREIRLALLEADVNFKVVKQLIDHIRAKAVGQEVMTALSPGEQVIKILRDELVEILGKDTAKVKFASQPPTVVLMAGLQGSGKTTTAAKLARLLRDDSRKKVLLVSCDVYRPAAMEQLRRLGKDLGIPVLGEEKQRPVDICRAARDEAAQRGLSPLILDTAGRLHIDEEMLDELRAMPAEKLAQATLEVVPASEARVASASYISAAWA